MNPIEIAWRRIQMMIGRGRVATANDSGPVQMLQVRMGAIETRDNTPRLADYGFTSFPHPGCDAVLVFLSGNRSDGMVIATGDQRYRLHLTEGEVAIHDDLGQKVHLTRSGIIVEGAGLPLSINNTPTVTVNASTEVILNTALLNVAGNINATGNISDQNGAKGTLQHIRDTYDVHNHGGVTSGGSNSAGPNNAL